MQHPTRILPFLLLAVPCFAGQSQQFTSPDQVPEGLQKSDWQSIRAAHEAWKHEFRQVDGQWRANNPGQRWTTSFDGRGFLTQPKEAEWTWGLQLESYGFDSNQQTVSGAPAIKVAGQRLSYHWQGGLEEWFVNDGRFRIAVEETNARYPITIDPIAQQAYLKPSAESLGYANVSDQFGASVAVSGDTVVVGAPYEDSGTMGINSMPNEGATNAGAAYVFVRSGSTWSQQAYAKIVVSSSNGSTTQRAKKFTRSMSLSQARMTQHGVFVSRDS